MDDPRRHNALWRNLDLLLFIMARTMVKPVRRFRDDMTVDRNR